jgi:FixJ family two-component response regulator
MTEPLRPLTEMQEAVCEFVARGWSGRRIAKRLGIDESTVRVHIHSVAQLLPNPDELRPQKLVMLWAAQAIWEKERAKP